MTFGVVDARTLEYALRARGAPVPARVAVGAYLHRLSEAEVKALSAVVRRMEQGVDRPGEIEQVLEAIRESELHVPVLAARSPNELPGTLTQPALPASSAGTAAAPQEELDFLRAHGVHVYATGAALKVELSRLPSGNDGLVAYTVQLEAARRRDGRTDWQHKIVFQLTRRELPLFAAFLLGLAGPAFELKHHGPATDKHLSIVDQGQHLYLKLWHTGQAPIPLPITPPDVYACAEICLVALAVNRPSVGPAAQLELLGRIGRMAQAAQSNAAHV